jgi:hypothetical protein
MASRGCIRAIVEFEGGAMVFHDIRKFGRWQVSDDLPARLRNGAGAARILKRISSNGFAAAGPWRNLAAQSGVHAGSATSTPTNRCSGADSPSCDYVADQREAATRLHRHSRSFDGRDCSGRFDDQ